MNSEAITKSDPANWNIEDITPSSHAASTSPFLNQEPTGSRADASVRNEALPLSTRGPGTWQSDSALARRNWLMISAIAASGFLLAALAFFGFIRSFGKPSKELAGNPAAADAAAPAAPHQETEAVAGPSAPASTTEISNVGSQPTAPEEASGDPSGLRNEKAQVDEAPVVRETLDSALDASASAPLFPDTDDDPSSRQAPPPAPSPEADRQANNPTIEDKLPSVFEDFQRWIDAPSRGNWDDIGKADRTIDTEIALENSEVLFREEYYPDAIPIPSWDERSQRMIVSVRTQPMPLLRCIDWFSKFTNTGIKADWLELNLAGVDFQEAVTIEGENVSVSELLAKFCQDRHLELYVDDYGFPHVRPTTERLTEMTGPGGILNSEAMVNQLSPEQRDAWIPFLIRMLDLGQCEYTQSQLKWSDDASLYDRARLLGSLGALKQTASNPAGVVELPKDPFDFAIPESWWQLRQRAQTKMAMDPIVHEERPVMDLLAKACAASGVQLVIDWPAVWEHGLHPSRRSISILRGRTLEEIANRYLEDYSLELVPLDSRTVLLTTDAVRRSVEQVVPVRLDRGMNIDDIKAAMRSLVPRAPDQRSRFRWDLVPATEQVAMLRVCLPALIHLRDTELQRAFGFDLPKTNTERD
jgi:hypothetical protein